MDLLQLLIVLVIAGICAAIAEWLIGFSPGGLLISIIVGVIGAYLGNWIARVISQLVPLPDILPIPFGTDKFDAFWAILGSILLLMMLYVLRNNNMRVIGRRP